MKNKYLYIAIGIIILILMTVFFWQRRELANKNKEINRLSQNISTLNDSVRIIKKKNGDLEYSKGLLILEKNEIKNHSKELNEVVNNTEGKVSEINKISVIIDDKKEHKTDVGDVLVKTNTDSINYSFPWKFDTIYSKDNYTKISGDTELTVVGDSVKAKNKITNITYGIGIYQGIREKNGLLEVFATSKHPDFNVGELSSIIIDPKNHVMKEQIAPNKHKWNVSIFGGYGINGKLKTDIYVGVGIGKTIFEF